jgi:hypothetical protein
MPSNVAAMYHIEMLIKRSACHSSRALAASMCAMWLGGQATHVYTHTAPAPGHAAQAKTAQCRRMLDARGPDCAMIALETNEDCTCKPPSSVG